VRLAAELFERRVVVAREVEQLARVGDAAGDALERADDAFEGLLLAPQLLRALRVVPQPGILELAVQRLEALLLGLEVKDTSAARWTGRKGP